MALLTEERRWSRALAYACQSVRLDPLREEAHLDLMRLYAAAGQISLALQQFEQLQELLERELHLTPSPAALALRRAIQSQLPSDCGFRISDLSHPVRNPQSAVRNPQSPIRPRPAW